MTYYERNKEKCKANARKYYEDNRDTILEKQKNLRGDYHKQYYQKNKERILTKCREYYAENREVLARHQREMRAINKYGNAFDLMKKKMFEEDGKE